MKKLKHLVSKRRFRKNKSIQKVEGVPLITNETVAAHREEVLSGARKYIYPLQHSKHKVVMVSTLLVILAVVVFFSYAIISLYKLQKTTTFMYRVTQIVPFPIARTGSRFVSYENYLFELRHYIHFYETQQKLSFEGKDKAQLDAFKQRAIDKVVDQAYIKQLADEKNITVTEVEIDKEITVVRNQNRLGSDNAVFEDVLRDYWGWSVKDFRRSLRDQLLIEKVTAALDPEARNRASAAIIRLSAGEDFSKIATEISDDEFTKPNGGLYPALVDKTSRDVPPEVSEELFKLQINGYTQPINTGESLEIVKLLELQGSKAKAAHILFKYKDIDTSLNELKDKQKAKLYIKLPEIPQDTLPE